METVTVRYLYHSGFAVEFEDTVLIFDYYLDESENEIRSLSTGVIEPYEIKDKKVLVFSSHRHPDHFNPIILSWKTALPNVQYFFSSDIPKRNYSEWTHILKPYEVYEEAGLKIQTFKSTDKGVAFLITLNGISIYHAGDLNWWHWNEESKAWNNNMAARFKYEISLLKEFNIDIAFLTADPRQEDAELWGLNWFIEQVNVKTVFPMHFLDDYTIMDRIKKEAQNKPDLNKVKLISKRGELFNVPITYNPYLTGDE